MLCGFDSDTGRDYSHRRDIVAELIKNLALIFAIDVANYSVLSNHFHLILRSRPDIVETWSDEECAWKYKLAWPNWEDGQWSRTPTDAEVRSVLQDAEKLARARGALGSISDFMARLKQPLATLFNAEMGTSGHFFDGRFKNRRLLSDDDALCCSFYCDLNQIRAGAAKSLIESHNSGIQDRMLAERARADWSAGQSPAAWRKLLEEFECGTPCGLDENRLRELYRDAWLAPISDHGPLATAEKIIIVNAAGEPIDLSATVRDETGELLPNVTAFDSGVDDKLIVDDEEGAFEDLGDREEVEKPLSPAGKPVVRKRGRPRKTRAFSIDHKLRKRLRRRKSDRCFLNIAWSEYECAVQALVDSIGKRGSRPAAEYWKETPNAIGDRKKPFYEEVEATLLNLLDSKQAVAPNADTSAAPSNDPPARDPPAPRPPPVGD